MSKGIIENQKTEAKISIQTNMNGDDTHYHVQAKKGNFEVICKGDGTLTVKSSFKTMHSAIGGRGEDDGHNASFSDKDCKTQSEVASNILELLMVISE